MKILENVSVLQNELFELLVTVNFKRGPEVYLYIDNIKCLYDNDTDEESEATYMLSAIEITVNWGRYYENEEKQDLNEDHTDRLYVEKEYMNNYDYIKGMFSQILKNN